jgi:hypothetical protein
MPEGFRGRFAQADDAANAARCGKEAIDSMSGLGSKATCCDVRDADAIAGSLSGAKQTCLGVYLKYLRSGAA